ncbi:hypothetical protein VTK56DRAFT_3517 [Thermocarpiscus australiensis]
MDDFVHNIAIESWTLYTVSLIVMACRIISRRMKFGSLRNLKTEDWLMLVAGCTYTGFTVAVNEVAENGSNYMDPAMAAALSPEGVATAVYGSKMTLVMEMCTLTTVWLVKACVCFLYYRLTKEAFEKQKLAVKAIACYCAISYVLVVVLLLTYWCRPIQGYWSVPVVDSECATYYNHMKFATSFNISSDLMLILIPLPIVIRTRLPLKRKLILCCVLGLGVFNIIAAVLNRYYNFSNPHDLGYVYWYVAEVAVSICVGNIPLCWPLIRRVFHADTWSDSDQDDNANTPARLRRPPRKRHGLHPTLWLTTWGQTAWDKMDNNEEQAPQRRTGGEAETDRASQSHSQGSEIELTPWWQRRANVTAVEHWGRGPAKETGGRRGADDVDKGVVVVKTVQVSRE